MKSVSIKKEVLKKAPLKRRPSARTVVRERSKEGDSPFKKGSFSLGYRFCAVVLLGIFLLQPTTSVFASEEVAESVAVEQESKPILETAPLEATELPVEDGPTNEVVEETIEVVSPEDVVEGLEMETVEIEDGEGDTVSMPLEESVEEGAHDASGISNESEDGEETVGQEESVGVASTTGNASEAPSTTTPVSDADTNDGIEEEVEVNTTDTESGAVVATTTARTSTTTEEVGVVMPEVSEGVSDLNRYQFGVNDCVTVEDGFFYCSKGTMPKMTMEDRVYAAQDADGDFEIFISKDGVDTQITHNLVDDNAPQYDAQSNRLAWHSLVNDRYQILVYDFANESMVQLTDETFNSMEPAMLGEKTVWQAWVVNNWEIILDDNGERIQLTTNESHDIDPFIRGDLISWQSQNGEGWDIKIFNTKTKELDIVAGAGGASAQNPRFVLMYDSTKENGDVETVGYDIESGETIPLAAVPSSVPETIPEPPHSKEKSAFVQTNPTLKNEVEAEVDDTVGTTTISGGDDEEDTSDVVMPPVVSSATSTVVENSEMPASPVSGMELDLRALATSTEEVVLHAIPDLVIPPAVSVETNASSSESL